MTAIRKVLIANRGEIACRVMRTAKARGIVTVAVYSDADAAALHVRSADEAIHIGGAEASASYLNIGAVIDAAKKTGADAIHPGYGFLSERADFAEACADAGIVFIGPPATAIAAMGDKSAAKRRMIKAGVPCVPGYQGDEQSDEALVREAAKIGFPVMVKASAGGGGRGMRIVPDKDELPAAILSARKEAESAFGDGRLLLERAVVGARHVEIQVFADAQGAAIHLGERDCSLQRRNQKVIEEAPSPVISVEKRAEMGAAAVRAAQAVGYVGAGTVEFLFDPARDEFYFLEMNTRLQVEHPVTECITGLDLVALQFDVAEGKPLPLTQEDVRLEGWAIEARLYAEDPAQAFMPQSGKISVFDYPVGPDVRSDVGVEAGDAVSAFYDPMVAKLIAYGHSRDEARLKLIAALKQTKLLGVVNNRDFLIALLEDETFAKGAAATDYIGGNLDELTARNAPGGSAAIAIVAAMLIDAPFDGLLTGWNSRGACTFPLRLATPDGEIITADIAAEGRRLTATQDAVATVIDVISKTANRLRYKYEGRAYTAVFSHNDRMLDIEVDGAQARYRDVTLAQAADEGAGADTVKAPMAGLVTGVAVKPGDNVAKGEIVATIEAMKMEHQLKAPRDGLVAEVLASEGDQVAIRAKLIVLQTEG